MEERTRRQCQACRDPALARLRLGCCGRLDQACALAGPEPGAAGGEVETEGQRASDRSNQIAGCRTRNGGHAQHRQAEQKIADHPAKPGRERPGGWRGHGGERGGRSQRPQEPCHQSPAAGQAARQKERLPGPDAGRNQQRDRRHAPKLHQEIRDDGAGIAEKVLRRRLGRVAKTGVCHGPGRQGRRDRNDGRGNQNTAENGDVPAQKRNDSTLAIKGQRQGTTGTHRLTRGLGEKT